MLGAKNKPKFASTRNACKLCTPFGACLAFKGINKAVPFLHGSQGCATYVRRYMISHFREPVDIASSNFTEETAVFGGGSNLTTGLDNVIRQYSPELVGIATTCLSETIGDDVPRLLREYKKEREDVALPSIVNVSTPSYRGTHTDGFYATVRAVCEALVKPAEAHGGVNMMSGMWSPADLRQLREIARMFGINTTILPDYAEILDGQVWSEYQYLPEGGTTVSDIAKMSGACVSLDFGSTYPEERTGGAWIEGCFSVPRKRLHMPVGIRQTDAMMDALSEATGIPVPSVLRDQRGRLVDSYIDAHRYIFGKRAVIYGEEDLVVGMAAFLSEIGVVPVMAVSGGRSGRLKEALDEVAPEHAGKIEIKEGADFEDMGDVLRAAKPDFILGNSKGYSLSRELDIPLIRVGFPIHDRFGGARILHIGYEGAQRLFDTVVNTVLDYNQRTSNWGYTYM